MLKTKETSLDLVENKCRSSQRRKRPDNIITAFPSVKNWSLGHQQQTPLSTGQA